MNQALTFILKLQDLLTPGMRQAANVSNTSAAQIEGQFNRINSGGRRMAASVDQLRQRLEAVNRVRFSTTIEREFNIATRSAQRLEKQINTLENKGRGSSLSRMVGSLAAGFGAFQLGKSALGGAAEREQQQISFGVMTGSQETGNKMLNDLVKMGAATPYESGDLIKNAQTLKAFGIENQKILPTLQMIGDVAAGDAQKLSSLSLAFAQTRSMGRLTGQDLLQMVNAGFNPLQQMVNDKVFPSLAKAREAMEKGAISTKMVESAFRSATGPGGQFHKMMEKQSLTLAGRWATFMDATKERLIQLGKALMPLASMLLTFAGAMMEGQPWALLLASAIGLIALSLSWATIQTTIYGAVVRSVTFFTGLWTGASAILNATLWLNPITWIIAGVIALIALIGYLIYAFDGWGKTWDNLMKAGRHTWNAFKAYFEITWLQVQDTFMSGIELMQKGWYKLKSLWDEEAAKAGLAAINDQQNKRANEIAAAKGVLQSEMAAAQEAMKWEVKSNGKSLGTLVADLKKKVGLGGGTNPIAATGGSAGGSGHGGVDYGIDGTGKSTSDSINAGGQRSITINIGKQIEKIEQHIIGGGREAAEELESAVREVMRRVVYSMNSVAS